MELFTSAVSKLFDDTERTCTKVMQGVFKAAFSSTDFSEYPNYPPVFATKYNPIFEYPPDHIQSMMQHPKFQLKLILKCQKFNNLTLWTNFFEKNGWNVPTHVVITGTTSEMRNLINYLQFHDR